MIEAEFTSPLDYFKYVEEGFRHRQAGDIPGRYFVYRGIERNQEKFLDALFEAGRRSIVVGGKGVQVSDND
jgi:hypothetical protein